ncbi:MAG: hypothetical protein O6939_01605 [Bacteroidetes bacterium]|nr:hypothetical protein [Bacteroidota bacterium]
MKTTSVILFSLLLAVNTFVTAQVGNIFPDMTAETATNKSVTIPNDTKGKYTLLGLAYSKKSEGDLNTWFSPIYDKFIRASADAGIFASFTYDVNVYFVPMFSGVKAAAAGIAKKKAIKNVEPEILPHILFFKGNIKTYKEALGFEKKDVPYFFVLDPDGKIVHATSGKFTEKKMDAVERVIED